MQFAPKAMLLLEDEPLILISLEELVRDMGVRDIHSCRDAAHALQVVRDNPVDCAILDIRTGSREDYEVADVLRGHDIPFVFATGVDPAAVRLRNPGVPVLIKPFTDVELHSAIGAVLGLDVNARTSPPEPLRQTESARQGENDLPPKRAAPSAVQANRAAFAVVGPFREQLHQWQIEAAHLLGIATYARSLPGRRSASLERARHLLAEVGQTRARFLSEVAEMPESVAKSGQVIDLDRAFDAIGATLERAARLLGA